MESIRYMSKEAPLLFVDHFHEVPEMINAFNNHYSSKYKPLWLSCIDEFMNLWLNKFCPGFMTLPRKPHPFGNKITQLPMETMASQSCGKSDSSRGRIGQGSRTERLPSRQHGTRKGSPTLSRSFWI